MEQIKFRAWDGEKMVSPDYITRDGIGHWKENSIPTQSDIIMQFTGLKDKYGVDVYEGAILSIDEAGIYDKVVVVIEWQEWLSNERWMITKAGWGLNRKCKQIWTDKTIEVIGNIYQNKDLLK